MEVEMGPFSSPFQVFPEEIWEAILEKVEDSADITNVIIAFPEIIILTRAKQFSWLIADVLPFLIPKFLNISDIKSCRLVSKRWRNAIGNCLESHSDRRPYKTSTMDERHFNYHRLPYVTTDFRRFFQSTQDEVHEDLYPDETKNPFPGRHVHFFVKMERDMETAFYCLLSDPWHPPRVANDVLSEAVPTMKLYGHHIWYLTFEFPYIGYLDYDFLIRRVLRPMFKCLSYLPNLKVLKLVGLGFSLVDVDHERARLFKNFIASATFPFRLDALQISLMHFGTQSNDLRHHLVTAFVNHGYVKKLLIKSDCWKPEYGPLFPSLTELCLILIPFDKLTLQNILQNLQAGVHLRKLEIRSWGMLVGEMLETLVPYHIESLQIFGRIEDQSRKNRPRSLLPSRLRKSVSSFLTSRFASIESPSMSNGQTDEQLAWSPIVSSVQCLSLKVKATSKLGFKFLNSFPSLKYLTVEIINGGRPEWEGFRAEQNGYAHSSDNLLRTLYNFYYDGEESPDNFKFIWNEFSNLKMLTVHKNKRIYQYVRECQNQMFCN